VDDKRKRIKSYAFSFETGLVWTRENTHKTRAWSKIACFVFVETKTVTSKNAAIQVKAYGSLTRFTQLNDKECKLTWNTKTPTNGTDLINKNNRKKVKDYVLSDYVKCRDKLKAAE